MGAVQSTSHPHTLKTPKGSLVGLEQRDKTNQVILHRYTKVPYALPPTGPLRWRRPQPLPKDYTFNDSDCKPGNYTSFGPICPQPIYNTDAALVKNPDAGPEIQNTQSEDCLYVNIWVPAGTAPEGGWPVQFQIHGGWLQVGDANQSSDQDPFDLLMNFTPRIIVSATYRLNLFGFLAGADLVSSDSDSDSNSSDSDVFAGNYGLWDQRAAIEWTYDNISLFGGNPDKITVGGLSAGAHSTFLQLYYDTYLPVEKRIIKQVYQWSNAIAIQPNSAKSEILTEQFNSLCDAVDVSRSLSAAERIAKLREVPAEKLVSVIHKLPLHTFRSSTDGSIADGGFIPPNFLRSLHDGSFTTLLAEHNVRIMLGEVKDEAQLYKLINPPRSRDGLIRQLGNYYPQAVVEALIRPDLYHVPKEGEDIPTKEWENLFATIVADCQVHASIRGLTHSLLSPPEKDGIKPLPVGNLFRYRVNWRAKSLDSWIKPKVGVCHAADGPIWWASGYRAGFDSRDREATQEFLKPFGEFLEGKEVQWSKAGNTESNTIRVIETDGKVNASVRDEYWSRGMEVWDAIWAAQKDQ